MLVIFKEVEKMGNMPVQKFDVQIERDKNDTRNKGNRYKRNNRVTYRARIQLSCSTSQIIIFI